MNRSETIGFLTAALAKAQGEIKGAIKDHDNPYFKSRYADLAAVWAACRGPLSANGLAVIQGVSSEEGKIAVETLLSHASGEWISERLLIPVLKSDPQGFISAATYGRRASLAAIVGVAPADEDDDGEAAQNSFRESDIPKKSMPPAERKEVSPPPENVKKISEAQTKMLFTLLSKSTLSNETFCEKFGIDNIRDLNMGEMNAALKIISENAKPPAGEKT